MQSGTPDGLGKALALSTVNANWDNVTVSVGCGNASAPHTKASAVVTCMQGSNVTTAALLAAAKSMAAASSPFYPAVRHITSLQTPLSFILRALRLPSMMDHEPRNLTLAGRQPHNLRCLPHPHHHKQQHLQAPPPRQRQLRIRLLRPRRLPPRRPRHGLRHKHLQLPLQRPNLRLRRKKHPNLALLLQRHVRQPAPPD